MPTVSYGITNTADDAVSVPALAVNSPTGALFGDVSFMSPGAKSTCALRFLGVGVGATDNVTAATITLTRHDGGPLLDSSPGSIGANAGSIKGVAVANQGALPADLTSLAKTTASTTIVPSATVVLDVLAQVNEIRALSGWAAGNAMAFVGDPSTADINSFIEIYDYASSTSLCAQLSITYEAGGPDETAPTITSGDTLSAVEGAALSHALTANEDVTWTKVGGSAFTLTGSTLSLPAQTYPSGPFEVVVRATDTAGNWTEQTITVAIAAAPTISFIGSATGTTNATMPAHQAGDLILCWAYRDGSNTLPTLASAGWTSLNGVTGANTNSARLVGKIAASSSEAVGTFTSATSVIVAVYRPKAGYALSFGAVAATTGASTTVSYPALTLHTADGSSWVAGFSGHRSVNTTLETPPSGMVSRATVLDATDEAAGHDTNGGVAAWTAQSVSVGGTSSGWRSAVVEIKVTYTSPTSPRKAPRYSSWL